MSLSNTSNISFSQRITSSQINGNNLGYIGYIYN